MRSIRERRGLSAVTSVIIIVAVALGLTLAVMLWTTGVIESFFKVEKVQLFVYTDVAEPPDSYLITIDIKNTGTKDAVINGVLLNGKPFWEANVSRVSFYIEGVNQTLVMAFLLPVGKSAKIEVYVGSTYYSNQNIEVKLHTASGNDILASARLP
ncbi:MAG: hypothetical protein QW057_00995 [Candidatus Bathyarchaeia archaeon]